MKITNIHQAKSTLSALIEAVIAGEEVIISKAGKPVAKLVPYNPDKVDRIPGMWRGKVQMSEDFDEALPPEMLKMFAGEEE
ncbi:type II toxin-antitoxin system Phd/YefM family antitoxin [Gloeocapsa sp. PCC 73106]|uniref:type II toxin-antitoxin system Phd/YefM family antitoxin n=1 Tax=Gloeocapsa sp. PCC 73106 TaxID=102232 RepID=UPI0002ACFFA1|nr:type II toxin-antitoxin system prevent-host-death family antitoxin [Gloeocapsa sp. PCC 73106]ELR99566.1 prevent-host-death family protein [Gloeocapsa sp. PCC 73106]